MRLLPSIDMPPSQYKLMNIPHYSFIYLLFNDKYSRTHMCA